MDLESQYSIYIDAIFSMITSSLDGFTLVNSNGHIIEANNSFCQLLGYTREELLEMHLSDIDAIDSVVDVAKRSEEILLSGSLRFETKQRHKSGSVIDVEVTANYTHLHGGLLFSCIRDITKQKQAEKATLLSEERYRNIVESQTEFVDRYTYGGILTYVNPALAKFTGVEAEALLGHSFYQFIHEDDRDECVRLIESISADNPKVEVSGHIVLPDGTSHWVCWSQTGIFDENGCLIEYQAVGKDVTDQRLAEIRLQESEEKYRLIFECAGDSISVMDLQGTLLAVNPLACNMLGYTYDELISLSADKIDARPDEMAANVLTLMQTGYYSGKTEFVRKDGTTVPISVYARKIAWEGQPAILSICRDITEQNLINRQLANAQKLENFGIIASGFTHNFNNALTSVLGYIELSLRSVEQSHKAYDLLACAVEATNDAAEMVSQLMIYSKEYKAIRKQPCSAVKLAEESIFLCTTGSKVTSRLIFLPTLHTLHTVFGDENLIRIAFQCICSNAVQAMPEGGTLTVKGRNVNTGKEKLPVLAKGDYVEISFEDQGCGIAENDWVKIFTPYYTHKAEIGAGLGLATVHSIITKHGGAVTFVSSVGKGTTFTLYLPAIVEPTEL